MNKKKFWIGVTLVDLPGKSEILVIFQQQGFRRSIDLNLDSLAGQQPDNQQYENNRKSRIDDQPIIKRIQHSLIRLVLSQLFDKPGGATRAHVR